MATTTRHPLKVPAATQREGPAAPAWPTYTGTSHFVGTSLSGRVTVYVDPTLGQPALQNAQDLVNDADRVVDANDNEIFGSRGGPVSVIIFAMDGNTDGTGGADHNGCDYDTGAAIEVCAAFGTPARVSALFEAELSECSMGGNLCGVSTGEALSRWCAAVVSNNALPDFATAPAWAQAGMPDWVNRTDPSDRHAVSTGCGMAFISWLLSHGYGLDKIAPAMVSLGDTGTMAQLYANLTGKPRTQAWPTFRAAVLALPAGVTTDDPFAAAASHLAIASVTPAMIGLAGKIFSGILADLATATPEHQIVSNVRALLASMPTGRPGAPTQTCSTKSHRLAPPGTFS